MRMTQQERFNDVKEGRIVGTVSVSQGDRGAELVVVERLSLISTSMG
jgi:hypothetical protein